MVPNIKMVLNVCFFVHCEHYCHAWVFCKPPAKNFVVEKKYAYLKKKKYMQAQEEMKEIDQ